MSDVESTLDELFAPDRFVTRHIGPDHEEIATMLEAVGQPSLDALIEAVVPPSIRATAPLSLPAAADEATVLGRLREIAGTNVVRTSLIGCGWYDCVTPPVLRRNVLESPAWYTAYTPYQPEISQGRLEILLMFQTMVSELTGMDIANASMLDESTAAAEAMTLLHRVNSAAGDRFCIDRDTHPQTIEVVRTRAEPLGIIVELIDLDDALPEGTFGLLLSHPGSSGVVRDLAPAIDSAHVAGALVAVATDLLACCLLTPPGELGADVVVGSAQRFGVPLGYGGPSAGFLATRDSHRRVLPGRLVGVSIDTAGRPAYRLALQTREQHIRREKATSNICTAQVLLAVMAALYAAWHGPDGLVRIASRVHRLTVAAAEGLRGAGLEVVHDRFFDTVRVVVGDAGATADEMRRRGLELRVIDPTTVSFSLDETTTIDVVDRLLAGFGVEGISVAELDAGAQAAIAPAQRRRTTFLQHPHFNDFHSETEMVRRLRRLADLDLALDRTMIPLGSCTMKLNAAAEMEPITWAELAGVHPFAHHDDVAGYRRIIDDLEAWLCEVTGYDAVSLQPNAGSQGEFAGLLAIRGWHRANGSPERDVCLIPASAHGTNAASAAMVGMRVVVIACDDDGNVDLADLRARIAEHADRLAALMVTYPSTHGVFEEAIGEICAAVHDAGGQVYLDGANLTALVGVARPGRFGADVSHLNLHKTFCIPHGGGGPGVGPVAVRAHLAPYLPGHPVVPTTESGAVGPVSAAPFGSAGILPIPWAYISMMGPEGLRRATEVAILSANYIARRLEDAYPILYTGRDGLVAHECILDLRPITRDTGVTVEDVAKRLIDYGFHAPTMSFPVAGTLMVESTESESLVEIDRFCDAMLAIRAEIAKVASGEWPADDNPLVHAPHTAADLTVDEWSHAYPRSVAGWPAGPTRDRYWPPVGRIDGAHGDRNPICSCPPVGAWASD
ncbi:MAG: aminomethyl-transferring glycine dehydrogenase [Acidimicrobiia bacterium]